MEKLKKAGAMTLDVVNMICLGPDVFRKHFIVPTKGHLSGNRTECYLLNLSNNTGIVNLWRAALKVKMV